MKILPSTIFSEFKNKVLDASYHPTDPLEILKAQLTATWLLADSNLSIIEAAEKFIVKTSSSFTENDLLERKQFSEQVQSWDLLSICSTYTDIKEGKFLEYELLCTAEGQEQKQHFHARFKNENGVYRFESQTTPLIRITSDPILQSRGIDFPENPTPEACEELDRQISIAKAALIQAAGAGIAANQCAAIKLPYRFAIVGVFYEIQEHVDGVKKRYPTAEFPQAIIMVNPKVTAVSKEKQTFKHACLSVPCVNRCAVKSPREMSVHYLNYSSNAKAMSTEDLTYSGTNAVVLWHELSHINEGKTYMDTTFGALTTIDLTKFHDLLCHEIQRRQRQDYIDYPNLSDQPYHFSVEANENQELKLNVIETTNVLPKMTNETLTGLSKQANNVLEERSKLCSEADRQPSGYNPTMFAQENKAPSDASQKPRPSCS